MESGKFVVRIDPKLHGQLKEEARSRGISLNDVCVEKLATKSRSIRGTSGIAVDADQQLVVEAQMFFGKDLLGFINTNDKVFLFLSDERQISALLDWDFEEKVLEKFPFRKTVKFLNLPKDISKISPEVKEVILFGEILVDQRGLLVKYKEKLRSNFLEQITATGTLSRY